MHLPVPQIETRSSVLSMQVYYPPSQSGAGILICHHQSEIECNKLIVYQGDNTLQSLLLQFHVYLKISQLIAFTTN